MYGGRGGAKSESIGRILLSKGANEKRRVLCAREFQNSIKESVHKLLTLIIDMYPELKSFYTITDHQITGRNGTEFIFKGVKQNADSIKSMAGLTDLWIEEAHTISQSSLDILIPTIRAEGSEIWISYNPKNEDDPVHQMALNPPPNSLVKKVSWRDNPWFTEELKAEKDHLFKVNPDKAMHVWEGECFEVSDAQIFKDKVVSKYMTPEPREKEWTGPLFGADWGSIDPTVLIKLWIYKPLDAPKNSQGTLYIEKEAYKTNVKINHLSNLFDTIEGSRLSRIQADNARPETIEYVSDEGFDIVAAEKWPNSVEEGVEYLKGFDEIVISPDCPEMLIEAKNYKYKEDKITGKVLPIIVDDSNHCWDAVRYALVKLIRASKNRRGKFTKGMSKNRIKTISSISKNTEAW